MTDIEIIREMEKILQVPLERLEPTDIVKKEFYGYARRGYSMNVTGEVTGLRLEYLPIKTVLEYIRRLRRVSCLNISGCQLEQRDIDFLRDRDELSYLNLSNNNGIQDFSFLQDLKGLTSLVLIQNNLTDVSFLRDLKGLTSVDLSENKGIQNFSILGELKGLTSVDLRVNELTDVSFLRDLKRLTSVDLISNKGIQNFSFLGELKGLTNVKLGYNELTNVSFLWNLKGLTSIYLGFNKLTDVSFLRELKGLTSLNLGNNELTDVSFLGELIGLTSIDLSSNKGIQDFSFLGELKDLTSVNLSGNNLSDVSFLLDLKKLTSVNLGFNNLTDISFLRELKGLTSVDLSSNKGIQDFSFLGELKGLTSVDLNWNNLTDISFLLDLKSLTSVNLGFNNLTDISFFRELKDLTSVNLGFNNLTDVSFLRELKGLMSVDLGNNKLTDVSFLRDLKGLTLVALSGNKDIQNFSIIGELDGLTFVALSGNKLTDASFLRDLKGLTLVNLSWNELTDISFVSDMDRLTYLNIENNPIKNPPPEIANQGLDAIRDYFRSLKEGTKTKLNEVKVLLVGDGGAGKTSLFKQLNEEPFDEDENKTHGVNINTIDYDILLDSKKTNIKTHFWDFGGQEIMHASHQFFLSKRSLYILVLDSRKDEKIEYWLKHIEKFGENSPVMIVINKIDDNPAFDLDRNTLTQKYKNIENFYRVSCKNGTGLNDFKNSLKKAIPRIELLQTPVADSWLRVKEKLEAVTIKKNYIDHQTFESICKEEQINDESSRDTLIRFLNELGIVLHFKELVLRDFHVLNPRWVTEAVYKIINSQFLADQKGILDTDELNYVLNEEKIKTKEYEQKLLHIPYKVNEQSYILSLMENFELCYRLPDNRILIPDLLDKKTPHFEIDEREALRYIVQYDFLPRNVISRFIVRMHKDIKDELRWRTGVVIEDRELHTTAVVKADENDRNISIVVTGKQKRDYFSTIRKNIREINNSLQKLDPKELVPLPDNRNEFVEYRELIGLEQMGELEYTSGKLGKKFPLKQLLDGIESESERQKYVSNYYIYGNVYSTKIKEGDKMSNQTITIGNNATIHGNIVAEIIKNSFNKIGTSNSSAELKTLLKDLIEEVEKIAEKLDKEKAEELANDLQAFTNEALSKTPRQKFWQLSAEGIKEAAKTVGELGLSAIMNVDKVIPLLDKLL